MTLLPMDFPHEADALGFAILDDMTLLSRSHNALRQIVIP